jgi:predicted SAM-dependent methyltransferase
MRLDVGGGTNNTKAPNHVNIDICDDADIKWDLNKGLPRRELALMVNPMVTDPLAVKDFVEGIRCHQVVEHLDSIIPLMNDCYEVMKEGAIMEISTPKGGTDAFWQDPTHKKGFVWESFIYFQKDSMFPDAQKEYGITARFKYLEHWMENGWNLQVRLQK